MKYRRLFVTIPLIPFIDRPARVNIENTELETTPSENGESKRLREKDAPAQGRPSRPPPSEPPPGPGGDAEQPETARRGGGFLAFLALLFSIAALALAGWGWWQSLGAGSEIESDVLAEVARLQANDSELSLKITQVREEIDGLASGDVSAEFEALQQRMRSDREKMAEVEAAMSDQLALSRSLQAAAESVQGRLRAAEAAVTNMSTRELDAGGELDLAEVDYLLRLANERLKLFSDPEAADQALEVADMHLAALNNPIYLGVRQEISAARQALSELNVPDHLEISRRLDAIQATIPTLSFIDYESPLERTAEAGEDSWWGKAGSALSSLVTVRRSEDAENQRLSLEDMDYVRQRLWLQLEIAHLALMRRDQQAFGEALVRVEETLKAWFDPSAAGFEEVVAGIDTLRATAVQVEMPDITRPWSTLRMLRSAAPPVPAGAAEEGDEATQRPVAEDEGGDGTSTDSVEEQG